MEFLRMCGDKDCRWINESHEENDCEKCGICLNDKHFHCGICDNDIIEEKNWKSYKYWDKRTDSAWCDSCTKNREI